MKTLVVGATGATGRLLVEQLLRQDVQVRVIVRSVDTLPKALIDHPKIDIIKASLLELSDSDMAGYVKDCQAVASCLGHNLSFKGIFGSPQRLVTEAVKRLCMAVQRGNPSNPVRFVLMNTTGNRNRSLKEPHFLGEHFVIGAVRLLLPPQSDNEQAAEYLRAVIGKEDSAVQWVVVRPDSLIDEDKVSQYELHPSPIRSPIFNAGKTSRINVAHFMAQLITGFQEWECWKGQMPVIYNQMVGKIIEDCKVKPKKL